MGKTLQQGFEQFLLTKLAPVPSEYNLARSHKNSVKKSIKNHIDGYQFWETGSFGNDTGIRHYSDSDYFAVILKDASTNNSKTMLNKLRDSLKITFPNTLIKVNSPSVCINFGQYASESIEVTPCFASNVEKGYKVYMIPDGLGGWMKSSPQAHNEYVKEVNDQLQGTLKPLIRFVKAWKYLNKVPILSFYLELVIAHKYSKRKTKLVYEKELHQILEHLHKTELKPIMDPMKISGWITSCDSVAKCEQALSKLNSAVERTQRVIEAAEKGEISKAFGILDVIFKKQFPAY